MGTLHVVGKSKIKDGIGSSFALEHLLAIVDHEDCDVVVIVLVHHSNERLFWTDGTSSHRSGSSLESESCSFLTSLSVPDENCW